MDWTGGNWCDGGRRGGTALGLCWLSDLGRLGGPEDDGANTDGRWGIDAIAVPNQNSRPMAASSKI